MNWDYDKLFANDNIIGIKNKKLNHVFVYQVIAEEHRDWNDDEVEWDGYFNDDLTASWDSTFQIEYIIRLDPHGNVAEHLFNRERDMPIYEPMPELKPGMFGMVKWWKNGEFHERTKDDYYANGNFLVSNNGENVIYQSGGFDMLERMVENTQAQLNGCFGKTRVSALVVEVYKNENSFSSSEEARRNLLWRNPEYQKYLDSNIKE